MASLSRRWASSRLDASPGTLELSMRARRAPLSLPPPSPPRLLRGCVVDARLPLIRLVCCGPGESSMGGLCGVSAIVRPENAGRRT